MSGRRRRRSWSDEEKREICLQAMLPGVSVARVARRYAVNANMIHKWLKDERFTAAASDCFDSGSSGEFLPVEIDGELPAASIDGAASPVTLSNGLGGTAISSSDGVSCLSAVRVDISLSDGRRILVEGATSLASVLGLVEGLQS